VIEIPVCYDGEFAPDLSDVARSAECSEDQVIQLHVAADYVVQLIGFAPGFPYLAGLPKRLHCPRRAAPRMTVPAGSVAIGGSHTGIYPTAGPGGWNVIGRTPVPMFDPESDRPCRCNPGDSVRFRRVTLQEFQQLSGKP